MIIPSAAAKLDLLLGNRALANYDQAEINLLAYQWILDRQTLTGQTITVWAAMSETIQNVKTRIQSKEGLQSVDQLY